MKKYRIERIEEPDFGCEGRPEGQPVMDSVYLIGENEECCRAEAADDWLYEMDINEGDMVYYSKETGLKKTE